MRQILKIPAWFLFWFIFNTGCIFLQPIIILSIVFLFSRILEVKVKKPRNSFKLSFMGLKEGQWWANLDQASKDLDKTIFRDLSPTPIP